MPDDAICTPFHFLDEFRQKRHFRRIRVVVINLARRRYRYIATSRISCWSYRSNFRAHRWMHEVGRKRGRAFLLFFVRYRRVFTCSPASLAPSRFRNLSRGSCCCRHPTSAFLAQTFFLFPFASHACYPSLDPLATFFYDRGWFFTNETSNLHCISI